MLSLMSVGVMREHIKKAFLIIYQPFQAYRKTVLFQSALTDVANVKRINITSRQDLKQC